MQHLDRQFGLELSHMWLGQGSVCSSRDYRFEQPKRTLRGGFMS